MTAPARYADDANVPPPERSALAGEAEGSPEVPTTTTVEGVLADLIAEIDTVSPPAASGMALRAYADFRAEEAEHLNQWVARLLGPEWVAWLPAPRKPKP